MDEQQNMTPEAAAACAKCDEYLAGWKRAQADYQNLKRDSDREKAEFAKYANERLLSELLPAIDQYGLAMRYLPDTASLPEAERKTWESWLVGVRGVYQLWEQAAKATGLERIPTDGQFDPQCHEAVGEEAGEGKGPGTILRVTQEGWKLHGKVLRPARVIITK
jgi:molecular chaperone GrpE